MFELSQTTTAYEKARYILKYRLPLALAFSTTITVQHEVIEKLWRGVPPSGSSFAVTCVILTIFLVFALSMIVTNGTEPLPIQKMEADQARQWKNTRARGKARFLLKWAFGWALLVCAGTVLYQRVTGTPARSFQEIAGLFAIWFLFTALIFIPHINAEWSKTEERYSKTKNISEAS